MHAAGIAERKADRSRSCRDAREEPVQRPRRCGQRAWRDDRSGRQTRLAPAKPKADAVQREAKPKSQRRTLRSVVRLGSAVDVGSPSESSLHSHACYYRHALRQTGELVLPRAALAAAHRRDVHNDSLCTMAALIAARASPTQCGAAAGERPQIRKSKNARLPSTPDSTNACMRPHLGRHFDARGGRRACHCSSCSTLGTSAHCTSKPHTAHPPRHAGASQVRSSEAGPAGSGVATLVATSVGKPGGASALLARVRIGTLAAPHGPQPVVFAARSLNV